MVTMQGCLDSVCSRLNTHNAVWTPLQNKCPRPHPPGKTRWALSETGLLAHHLCRPLKSTVRTALLLETTLWSRTNSKFCFILFPLESQSFFVLNVKKIIKRRSSKTAGLIEVEFKSERSAWAEGIEPLPWVPAPVEGVATTALLTLCI